MDNSDEVKSMVTKAVLVGLSLFTGSSGTAYGFDTQTIASAIGLLAAFGYAIYLHWNMRKVPSTAIVTALAPTVDAAKAASITPAK